MSHRSAASSNGAPAISMHCGACVVKVEEPSKQSTRARLMQNCCWRFIERPVKASGKPENGISQASTCNLGVSAALTFSSIPLSNRFHVMLQILLPAFQQEPAVFCTNVLIFGGKGERCTDHRISWSDWLAGGTSFRRSGDSCRGRGQRHEEVFLRRRSFDRVDAPATDCVGSLI